MVDVSLRHKRTPNREPTGRRQALPLRGRTRQPRALSRPLALWVAAIVIAIAVVFGLRAAMNAYYANAVLSGFTSDTTPVELVIASEPLAVPANMIRSAKVRAGGETERIELAVHWPTLGGYTEELAGAFRGEDGTASIVYLGISPREMAADSTGRLADVYSRFFVGPASPGPHGLVGRRLSEESGYGGEIVFFTPAEAEPFVTRCIDGENPEIRATCLRDINIGNGLSLLYRFDRSRLADWAELDASLKALAARFLGR